MTPRESSDVLALPRFPGNMTPDETEILRDWLRVHAPAIDHVAFNVRLGVGRRATAELTPEWVAVWLALTQLRADAVVYRGADVEILEAKHHARVSVATQVRRYALSYAALHEDAGRVTARVICRTADAGVDVALLSIGGVVEIVPAHQDAVTR